MYEKILKTTDNVVISFLRHLNGTQVLQLGGVNEDLPYVYPQLQHKHFTGCIRNLVVDSKVTLAAMCFLPIITHPE